MNVDIDDLIDALTAVADQVVAGDEVDLKQAFKGIPVPLRAVLAAIVLTAAGEPLTGKNLEAAGGFGRGSALRDHGETIAKVKAAAPAVVRTQLAGAGHAKSYAELWADFQQRNDTIDELRTKKDSAERDLAAALSYARDLHEQLRPEYEAIAAEKTAKVRHLHTVPNTDGPDLEGA